MSEAWTKEICPGCGAANWLPTLSEDDIGSYDCWQCTRTIRLFSGELQDEYDPHIEGTPGKGYAPDESGVGVHWDGEREAK